MTNKNQNITAADASVYDDRYSDTYRQNLSGFERSRWKALQHFSPSHGPCSPKKVLDHGAGAGLYAPLWKEVYPDAEHYYCDISREAKVRFAEKFPGDAANYGIMEGFTTPFEDDKFDVVFSVEVIEHVADLQVFMQDVGRVLKPGGCLIWTTPCGNRLSVEHVFAALTGRIQPTDEGYRRWSWEDPTHVRRLRGSEITAELLKTGFKKPTLRYRSHLFSFLCTYAPPRGKLVGIREQLMNFDYSLFRMLPNGASMVGCAVKE